MALAPLLTVEQTNDVLDELELLRAVAAASRTLIEAASLGCGIAEVLLALETELDEHTRWEAEVTARKAHHD